MPHPFSPFRTRPARGWLAVVIVTSALGSCRTAPPAQAGAEPGAGALPDVEVTRLSVDEADLLAEEIRAAVPVELADGLTLDLWASDPLLIDPIALDVDDRGHVYVTGTARTRSFLDIRNHPTWVTEALSLRTTDDYRRFVHRRLSPERSEQNSWLRDINEDGVRDWRDLTVERERVIRLLDTTGDGRADLSQVMREDFHTEITDVAGGVRVHDGWVYVGVAPDVWRLRDSRGDGVLDVKELHSHGYGTHPGFAGHGVSGIEVGPDGRIYWSVGDMGLHVTDREGRVWDFHDQGAVLRSEPDGSGFEVFAAGLRNTHEFAFDEWGNLISVDNDGDHPGETERLVYLVDGSDSGWRVQWQFGKYTDERNTPYKVWMDEGLFRPRFAGQAAYILPPLAAYHTGPAGMVFNPGTALDDRWRNHFFVSEFTGSAATAKIHAFRLRPSGASFALDRDTVVMRGILTTGMRFGPDGALYLADWIEGWSAQGSGRIWRLDAPAAAASAARAETRALLAEPFDRRPAGELARFLRHADRRVRQKAQFALAARGDARTLGAAARQRENRLARAHGIWGLGQLARRDARHAAALLPLLGDPDAEIRAQAARTLGDVRHAPAADALVALLRDAEPRPRFFAAEALGRIGHRPATAPIVAMLAANDDRDTYLRHAGSLALARIGDVEAVAALAAHPSVPVRVAGVVALRRMRDPAVARFLADRDGSVAAEAARAINDDASIPDALPELAALLDRQGLTDEVVLRRAVNASVRLGTPEAARRLASFAARESAPGAMRVEAVAALGVFPAPSPLDRVDGTYRGAASRDAAVARAAVTPLVASHLATGSAPLRVAIAEAAGRLHAREAAPALLVRVRDDTDPAVRVAALRALGAFGGEAAEPAVRAALADREPSVRMAALTLIPGLGLPAATTVELLAPVVERGTTVERQSATEALGRVRGAEATRTLSGLLERLERDRLPAEIRLDVLEAAETSGDAALVDRVQRIRAARRGAPPAVAFSDALRGGSAARGRQIAMRHPSAECTRCHVFDGDGTGVGPNLRGIGSTLSRVELLEALVAPAARVPPGYGIVSLTLRSGETVIGPLQEETASAVVVQSGAGPRRVERSAIAQRTNISAMPSMEHLLSRRELRDVVEYLTTLRRTPSGEQPSR
jgi:quinoprotein glucose dehydrogenase